CVVEVVALRQETRGLREPDPFVLRGIVGSDLGALVGAVVVYEDVLEGFERLSEHALQALLEVVASVEERRDHADGRRHRSASSVSPRSRGQSRHWDCYGR